MGTKWTEANIRHRDTEFFSTLKHYINRDKFRISSGEEARKKMKELEGKGIKAKWWIEPVAPEWFGPSHSSSPKDVRAPVLIFRVSPWKEKVADAIAKMVVYRGRYEKRDADELAEAIRKMLDNYEKEWG